MTRFILAVAAVMAVGVYFGIQEVNQGIAEVSSEPDAVYVEAIMRAKKNRPPTVSIVNPPAHMLANSSILLHAKVKDKDGDRIRRMTWSSRLGSTFDKVKGLPFAREYMTTAPGWETVTVRAWDGLAWSKRYRISFCVLGEDSRGVEVKPADCP